MKKKTHLEKDDKSCKEAGKVWVKSVKRTPHCRGRPTSKTGKAREINVARDVEKDKMLPVVAAKVVTLAREVEKDKSLPMMAAKVLYKDGKKVEKEKRKIDKIIKLSKKVSQRLNAKGKPVFRPLKGVIQKKQKKIIDEVRAISTALARRPANKDIGKLAKLLEVKPNEPKLNNVPKA